MLGPVLTDGENCSRSKLYVVVIKVKFAGVVVIAVVVMFELLSIGAVVF